MPTPAHIQRRAHLLTARRIRRMAWSFLRTSDYRAGELMDMADEHRAIARHLKARTLRSAWGM